MPCLDDASHSSRGREIRVIPQALLRHRLGDLVSRTEGERHGVPVRYSGEKVVPHDRREEREEKEEGEERGEHREDGVGGVGSGRGYCHDVQAGTSVRSFLALPRPHSASRELLA